MFSLAQHALTAPPACDMGDPAFWIPALQAFLSARPDLRNRQWAGLAAQVPEAARRALGGHCYIGAEALYFLVGGKASRWRPCQLSHDSWPAGLRAGETHWYLVDIHSWQKHKGDPQSPLIVADPTAEQYAGNPVIPYARGAIKGFQTRVAGQPSRRAQLVIAAVRAALQPADTQTDAQLPLPAGAAAPNLAHKKAGARCAPA